MFHMRHFIICLVLLVLIAGLPGSSRLDRADAAIADQSDLVGRWRVKFSLSGTGEKNLIFDARPGGAGSFLLLDTGPDNKPAVIPLSAAWSEATNNRVSFSGEAEVPIGTCCREIGTLIFKGKLTSNDTITGKTIFIGITDDEENCNGRRTSLGSFTATRVPEK
jgi:hypothetical protein